MNGSQPYIPSSFSRTSCPMLGPFGVRAFPFPSPFPSPLGRGKQTAALGSSGELRCADRLEKILPLPKGVGGGEGELGVHQPKVSENCQNRQTAWVSRRRRWSLRMNVRTTSS